MAEQEGNKEQEKRAKEMIADLRSKNERKVIGALKRVPHDGTPDMIEPLFDIMAQNPSDEVRILLEKTLNNLKDPNCVAPMVGILRNEDKADQHREVLSSLWQSGLDVTDELELLVDLAIQSDYLTVIEVVTIIENLEFDDDSSLTDSIAKMDEAVEVQGETQDLLVSLRQLLLDKLLGDA